MWNTRKEKGIDLLCGSHQNGKRQFNTINTVSVLDNRQHPSIKCQCLRSTLECRSLYEVNFDGVYKQDFCPCAEAEDRSQHSAF